MLVSSGAYSRSKSDQTYKFEEKKNTRSVVNDSYYFQMPAVIILLEWLSSDYLSSLPLALVTCMTSFYKIRPMIQGKITEP